MFNRKPKRTYQYGEDPRHTVKLTEDEAYAVNNLLITDYNPETSHGRVNLNEDQMKDYNRAATILNRYIKRHGGSIPCSDDWLAKNNGQILTLIK